MATKEKISVNSFDKAYKEIGDKVVTMEWNGLDITVKKRLECKDAMSFIEAVIDGCISKDDGEYHPEVKRLAIRLATIASYTNMSLPRSTEKQYDMAYAPGLYSGIMNIIDQYEYMDICHIISEKIDVYIRTKTDTVTKNITDLSGVIDKFQRSLSNSIDGINPDEIKAVFESLTNGAIDEEKFAKAYLKAAKEE